MTIRLNFSISPFKVALLFCLMTGVVSPVLAAEIPGGAQPIKLGEGNLYLSGRLRYMMDDNKNRSATNPQSLSGVVLSPTAVYVADQESLSFQASYEGGYGSMDDSNFDFEDHLVAVNVGSVLSRRLRAGVGAFYAQRHEEFDEQVESGVVVRDNLVISRNTQLNAGLRYGASNARGNVSTDLRFFRHKLDELDAAINSVAPDYDLVEPAVQLSLRVSQDTRFTIGVVHGLYDYDSRNSDRSITRGLLGLRFSPTGKLKGYFRIGSAYTSFDTGVNPSRSKAVFSSNINFRPVSYSKFALRAERRLDNTDNSSIDFSGSGTVSDIVKLEWLHQWTSRVATDSYVSLVSTDRECPSSSSDSNSAGVRVIYSFLRSWSLTLGIQQDSRRGSLCENDPTDPDALDYDRQYLDVTVGYTL